MQRGILLCHGHTQKVRLPDWLPIRIEWTMVDINPATEPDIVGDFTDPHFLSVTGLHQYDYVVSMYCPIIDFRHFEQLLVTSRRLLRDGGILIVRNNKLWYQGLLRRIEKYPIKFTDKYLSEFYYDRAILELSPLTVLTLMARDTGFESVEYYDNDLIARA